MSGDLRTGEVVLRDTPDGAIERLVRTAGTLFAEPGFAPAALVGGLAVTIRLAAAHRATVDVDTVVDGDVAKTGRIEVDGSTPSAPVAAAAP